MTNDLKARLDYGECSIMEQRAAAATIERLETRIRELEAEFSSCAGQIEKLSFDMKPPNSHTPKFVMLANKMRATLLAFQAARREK